MEQSMLSPSEPLVRHPHFAAQDSQLLSSGEVGLNCVSESVLFWSKGAPFRISVALACCLSAAGALLIIISYAFFKSLRSRARLVLVHLSVMDLGVSLTNLAGILIHFDGYFVREISSPSNDTSSVTEPGMEEDGSSESQVCPIYRLPDSMAVQRTCTAQAFLAHYFTYGSVLWTIGLAVFIYFVIVHYRQPYVKHVLRASYVVCYGLPVVICLWLLLTHRFGYSPANGLWCSILLQQPGRTRTDRFAAFFGYDLWIYLAFVVVPVFFIAVKIYIREQIRHTKLFLPEAETRFWEALYILDYKFLLIPLVFFILRIWACIQLMINYYIDLSVPLAVEITLNYLSSIGDSSQGFANAILFVLFTKKVRLTIFSPKYWRKGCRIRCIRKRRRRRDIVSTSTISGSQPIESEILTPSHFTDSLSKPLSTQLENSRKHKTIN